MSWHGRGCSRPVQGYKGVGITRSEYLNPHVIVSDGGDLAVLSYNLRNFIADESGMGYLKGPYEHRGALDEVVQMQSGIAYMTGPPGQPLRAGASIIDILGAVFGVVAVLAALNRQASPTLTPCWGA